MSKKVLMTASTLSHISNFHLPYIKAFQDLGWEVHVAGSGPEREIPAASEVYCLEFEKSFGSVGNFKTALKLRTIMRRNKYDLIICHTSLAAFFTRLATLGIKRKTGVINVVHGYLFDENSSLVKGALLKGAEYLMAGQTDLLLTMNDWDYSWAKEHRTAKKVRFIPGMGISKRPPVSDEALDSLELGEDKFVLVYPAEFSARKNQSVLIRGMCMLPENVRLVLPGNGTMLEECRMLARELKLEERVLFPGYVKDVFSLLKKADAAVSSSRSEGLPFNIMEAMLSGLPVIASNVKGNSDLVKDGVNGYLFDCSDENAFAEAVTKLMADKENAKAMGTAGSNMVKKYELEDVLPLVMQEYLNLEIEK